MVWCVWSNLKNGEKVCAHIAMHWYIDSELGRLVQVGRDEVPQATVRGETERWAGLYSGPGAASA